MRTAVAALVLALLGLVGLAAPADAATCETNTFRSERVAGFRTLVTIRRVTVCRNGAGQVVDVRVAARHFTIGR